MAGAILSLDELSPASSRDNVKIEIMTEDDEPPVLHVLKTLLEAHGYQVIAMASHSRANESTSQGTRTAGQGISLA